jgi:hypothetical protein
MSVGSRRAAWLWSGVLVRQQRCAGGFVCSVSQVLSQSVGCARYDYLLSCLRMATSVHRLSVELPKGGYERA